MKKRLWFILKPVISCLVAAVVVCALIFGVKPYAEPQQTTINYDDNCQVYGYCISDLAELNYLKHVYYTPNQFVTTSRFEFDEEIASIKETVDLTSQKNFAKRGSFQFFIYALDPMDENFNQKKKALDPFLADDNQWHFALYLPPCFSACCVYVNERLVHRAGEIKDYNYKDYSDKQGYSETHTDGTASVVLDLTFHTRREGMGVDFQRARIITVHYESSAQAAGFDGVPIIGASDKVNAIVENDRNFLVVTSLLAICVFVMLVYASALKRSAFVVPQILLALGVAGFAYFKLVTYSPIKQPIFVATCTFLSVAMIVAAAVVSVVFAITKKQSSFLTAAPIALTFGVTFLCLYCFAPVLHSPLVWLAFIILGITAFTALAFFAKLEKTNVYLTNNLQSEVSRQTESLQAVVAQRDRLLRYLSHDMKKPVTGIQNFVKEIRKNETNGENVKALDIIDGKLNCLQSDFAQLQQFSKVNFSEETSANFSVKEFIEDVYTRLSPDCVANGITLKCTSPQITVFAKRSILKSVVDNLVFNAIEHSHCQNIEISAAKSNDLCKLKVVDDGVGVANAQEMFLPYTSANADEDNLGLGLYICRQHVLSMGGELEYSCSGGKTVFCVTLPLA